MILYQQTRLSDTSAVGSPGPLPYVIANWTDGQAADLDAAGLDPQFGLAGMGFWPVDVSTPAFDPNAQVLVPPTACSGVDATVRRWSATAAARAMTGDERAARPMTPVSGAAIIGALSDEDAAKCRPRDLLRIAPRDDVPAANNKLGRIAEAIGATPDALRQAGASAA